MPMPLEFYRQYLPLQMTVNVDKKNPQYAHANPCVYWG